MRLRILQIFFLSTVFALWSASGAAQAPANASRHLPAAAEEVFSWLPSDTETVMVAQGPLAVPYLGEREDENNEDEGRAIGTHELAEEFGRLSLGMLRAPKGSLAQHLQGRQLLLSIEGSRHFRPPHGLGGMLFEGCLIAVFSQDLGDIPASYLRSARNKAVRAETIAGQKVLVFQEQAEDDLWTIWLTFPRPNVILVATNQDYLQEVLLRMQGKHGERALPDSLPEWNYVNPRSQFWALRHYDPTQANDDPSSPLGNSDLGWRDEKAIGSVFNLNPGNQQTATVTHLSGDKQLLDNLTHASPEDLVSDPVAENWHVRRRELSPGVVEMFFDLEREDSVGSFVYLLENGLGHGAYL